MTRTGFNQNCNLSQFSFQMLFFWPQTNISTRIMISKLFHFNTNVWSQQKQSTCLEMKFKNNFEGPLPLNGDALLTIGNHHATGFSSSSRFWFFRICIFDFIFKDSWVILFLNFICVYVNCEKDLSYSIKIVVSLKEFITRLLASFKIQNNLVAWRNFKTQT